MRGMLAIGLLLPTFSGCAPSGSWTAPPGPPVAVFHDNPMLLPISDPECVWEMVVDVVDDYFEIEREEPVRVVGDTLTEGLLATHYKVGATVLEPWHEDSAGREARIESTLQSIRRRAVVRVMPTNGAYWVDVAVFKELEDVPRPEHATAGAATLRYDASLTRVVNPVGPQETNVGWISQGRDTALEQRILGHLLARSGQLVAPVPGAPHNIPISRAAPLPDRPLCSTGGAYRRGEPWGLVEGPGGLVKCSQWGQVCSNYGSLFAGQIKEFALDTSLDYEAFYSCRYLGLLGIGLGTAAVMANTPIDDNFQQWYIRQVVSRDGNDFSREMKRFGEGSLMLPIFAGALVLGPWLEPVPGGELVGDWGSRCLRSVLVGGPPLLTLQRGLGASRPGEDPSTSNWKPFDDDNAVSGHAFMGAIAFVNAAKMTDDVGLKLAFYAVSVLPAWSRVNDNSHYLSQAMLGWWLAYLAASAGDETERFKRNFAVMPLAPGDGMGLAVAYRW